MHRITILGKGIVISKLGIFVSNLVSANSEEGQSISSRTDVSSP
jgi:hypothetical protein